MPAQTTHYFSAVHEDLGNVALAIVDLDAFIHAPPSAGVAVYFDDEENGEEQVAVVLKSTLSEVRTAGQGPSPMRRRKVKGQIPEIHADFPVRPLKEADRLGATVYAYEAATASVDDEPKSSTSEAFSPETTVTVRNARPSSSVETAGAVDVDGTVTEVTTLDASSRDNAERAATALSRALSGGGRAHAHLLAGEWYVVSRGTGEGCDFAYAADDIDLDEVSADDWDYSTWCQSGTRAVEEADVAVAYWLAEGRTLGTNGSCMSILSDRDIEIATLVRDAIVAEARAAAREVQS